MAAQQTHNVKSGCPVAADSTCILVGNGPSATQSKLGRVIDSFDEVVRFNQFRVAGFEEYLGGKTTIYSTFGKGMTPHDPATRPDKVVYIHGENGDPAWEAKSLWRIPIGFFWDTVADFNSTNNEGKTLPSSGFLMASWLLAQGVKRLHLLGFDHFAKHDSSKQHHYWLAREYKTPREHNGSYESCKFAEWVREGKVFYLG